MPVKSGQAQLDGVTARLVGRWKMAVPDNPNYCGGAQSVIQVFTPQGRDLLLSIFEPGSFCRSMNFCPRPFPLEQGS